MKVLYENRSLKQVKVYDPYADFDEEYPEPALLFLSSGTVLNEFIR